MKKILYLHGFASSGASGTVELLRRTFYSPDRSRSVSVVAPDIPVDPVEALPMLKELAAKERPDLVIGTSMGGMYAQQLHGLVRICVNPSFAMSTLHSALYVGRHKWFNRRRDGEESFKVTKDVIAHFRDMEAHQFDGVMPEDVPLCHGLFGDADDVLHGVNRETFLRYYPGQLRMFRGGHRMNADIVNATLIPFIRETGALA